MNKRRKWVAGNWKMNGNLASNEALIQGFLNEVSDEVDVSIFCPYPYLSQVRDLISDSPVFLGAQDVSSHAQGAYTGEVSVNMLKDVGVQQVLVGHSERRAYHAESSETVGRKAAVVASAGLTPVVCIGETLQERESGRVESALASQIDPIIERLAMFANGSNWPLAIAYEPVWAIGTGASATPAQAQVAHEIVRERLAAALGEPLAQTTRILYGGSVKSSNAGDIFEQPDIDGGLIGGASLNSGEFSGIMRAAKG